jgi:hypothetical protein
MSRWDMDIISMAMCHFLLTDFFWVYIYTYSSTSTHVYLSAYVYTGGSIFGLRAIDKTVSVE